MKNMIKSMLSFFVFLKFKNIWNIKDYLVKNNLDKGIVATVYDYYIHKEGGYVGITSKFANHPYMPHGFMGVFISDMSEIGKNAVIFQQVTIGADRLLDSNNQGNPKLGDNVYIGAGAKIIGNVKIGDNVFIGPNVSILTPIHPLRYEDRNLYAKPDGTITDREYSKPIVIGNNCWIAGNVTICGGAVVGERCVIGAGSVVTGYIPPNTIAAGVPCKVIREITDADLLSNHPELEK